MSVIVFFVICGRCVLFRRARESAGGAQRGSGERV